MNHPSLQFLKVPLLPMAEGAKPEYERSYSPHPLQ